MLTVPSLLGCVRHPRFFQQWPKQLRGHCILQVSTTRYTTWMIFYLWLPLTRMSCFLQVLQHLGVPVATEKTEGPATSMTILGVLIDTQNLELRLPSDKLSRLQALVSDWQKRHTCTRKELESLLGHLSQL